VDTFFSFKEKTINFKNIANLNKTPEQKLYMFKRRNSWCFNKNSGPIPKYLLTFKPDDGKNLTRDNYGRQLVGLPSQKWLLLDGNLVMNKKKACSLIEAK
jgi:hypothetical protein